MGLGKWKAGQQVVWDSDQIALSFPYSRDYQLGVIRPAPDMGAVCVAARGGEGASGMGGV